VTTTKPFVLVICDGWGESPEKFGNAITGHAPNIEKLKANWPHTTLAASGQAVGLPTGQMGNSEIGHLTIGAGRIIREGLSRQIHELATGSFYDNEVLITAIELAVSRGTALHIMGLVSPGGVHSHQDSALAIARLAKRLGLSRVHVHAFTDGRDMPPKSAVPQIEHFENELAKVGAGRIASLSGRYYAMDRDNRWDRIEQVYQMLTADNHPTHQSPTGYIQDSYQRDETDEFLKPISIAARPADRVRLNDDDVVIFFNFRPDRARQLTRALADADFQDFKRQRVVHGLHVVTLAEYERALNVAVAFPKPDIHDTLTEIISRSGETQFHVAETEKYAHVTYFLNGGREKPFPHEERLLVPSPQVAFYDEAPAMSAEAVAGAVIERLQTHRDRFIVVNFANPDMVGHTGNLKATQRAIEVVDQCIARIVDAVIKKGGAILITADHGNAEKNTDAHSRTPLTAHTTAPVPAILCGTKAKSLRNNGGLQDIAPTILKIMELPAPGAMTGQSLL
jgi:2,3-bisphosphoglycerate-independent phosphoglycerate mutase